MIRVVLEVEGSVAGVIAGTCVSKNGKYTTMILPTVACTDSIVRMNCCKRCVEESYRVDEELKKGAVETEIEKAKVVVVVVVAVVSAAAVVAVVVAEAWK